MQAYSQNKKTLNNKLESKQVNSEKIYMFKLFTIRHFYFKHSKVFYRYFIISFTILCCFRSFLGVFKLRWIKKTGRNKNINYKFA